MTHGKHKQAIRMLDEAIARHQRHMNGKESTSNASQMKLMESIKMARRLLAGMEMEDDD